MPRSLGYKQSKRRKLYGYGTASFCNNTVESFTHLVKVKKHLRRSNCGDYVNAFISTPFHEYSDNIATSVTNTESKCFMLRIPSVLGSSSGTPEIKSNWHLINHSGRFWTKEKHDKTCTH